MRGQPPYQIKKFIQELAPVYYYKKSSKRLLHFRSQKIVQLIIDLMYRNQKGFLAYEISNGIKIIKGEDFLYEGPPSSTYGGDKKTANLIIKYGLELTGTKLNPILKNHLKQPNKAISLFEGRWNDFNLYTTSSYKSNDNPWDFGAYYINLGKLQEIQAKYGDEHRSTLSVGTFHSVTHSMPYICDPKKTSQQYAFLWEYVSNPEYNNISSVIISLSDFNFTSNTIFSMSLNDILSLSELEKVVSYQIYPTHEVSDKSISNSSASKTFKIKIQKNRTNINIRKKPVNGVLVGQVSGGQL
jgi:hypothetical protein